MFSIFRCYPLFIIWTPGQSISLVIFARLRDDNIVESGQEQRPSSLMSCEGLLSGKILEVCMI